MGHILDANFGHVDISWPALAPFWCMIWSEKPATFRGACFKTASIGSRERKMATEGAKKVRRILQLKFTLPAAEPSALIAVINATRPYYELFGGKEMRLLQNVDQPTQFIQIIDYDIDESFETSRQQFAGDPRLRAFLQAWRTMFPGTVEIDIFREIEGTDQPITEEKGRRTKGAKRRPDE